MIVLPTDAAIPATVLLFALTYLGMAFGRVPGLRIDRTGVALLAATALLALGLLPSAAFHNAVNFPTLAILFSLMIVSAQFGLAGFYDWAAARIASAKCSPFMLLALTIAIPGALSAVLINDVVVFALTPVLCQGIMRRGLDPRPFLIALAAATNAGSAATLIGNPQNILIGQTGGLDFWRFLAVCGPPALAALVIVFAVVSLLWRRSLMASPVPLCIEAPPVDRQQVGKATMAIVALIAMFGLSLPGEASALIVAALLLVSRKLHTRQVVAEVDWHLLLLIACLFVVNTAFRDTGLPGRGLDWLEAHGFGLEHLSFLTPLALIASNTIGNVPAVIMVLSLWPSPSAGALYGLALLSTLAGNLLLVGSLANIIVAERASTVGTRLGFLDHARSGVPIALLSFGIAGLWLWLGGWTAW
jgi:Na+/H+ antiporter NhaD/arsenite permease-like protein